MNESAVPDTFDAILYLKHCFLWKTTRAEREAAIGELAAACGRPYPWSHAYLANIANGRQPLSKRMRSALYRHAQGYGRPPIPTKSGTLGKI
jgi:hypothetical protein